MQKIDVESSEIWDYSLEHEDELSRNQHLMAENDDYGMEVWLTMANGSPELIVECDGNEIYREDIFNEKDAKRTADRIYDDYLSIKAIETMTDSEDKTVYTEDESEEEYDDEQMLIDEREEEIDAAVRDFVNIVSDTGCYNLTDEAVDDLKEHFLEYMHRKLGISIYRPMYLEDADTGEDYFTEYPYDDMVFEDDNPIYKQDKN
jgi:hypothetical protein